jgi:aspartyl-tRNA(Asn)/glutamyl-tRNA(Gln) amidotransferase subunit A
MRPTDFTLRGALDALSEGIITSEALTRAHLDAIAALNPRINAYITVTGEAAMEAARASDLRRAEGLAGPLEGIPLAIKDLFCTAGVRTTAGSRILGEFVPPYESTVSANLLRDGAVFLGKANLDEFAMGSSSATSAFGEVENPWKRGNDTETRLVPAAPPADRRRRSRRTWPWVPRRRTRAAPSASPRRSAASRA